MITVKATRGLKGVVIVADCPFCHGRHEHNLGSLGELGTREAGCLRGQYTLELDYSTNKIKLTSEYWDCECEESYIHPRIQKVCVFCGVYASDQPDSRVDEVLKAGLLITEKDPKASE
jgi:ABC-type microcin C transport system duplicated ATPase subunit YejF